MTTSNSYRMSDDALATLVSREGGEPAVMEYMNGAWEPQATSKFTSLLDTAVMAYQSYVKALGLLEDQADIMTGYEYGRNHWVKEKA